MYWGALFLRLEEEYWRSPFLSILKREMKRVKKIWSDFGAEQKWRAERKESGFCSYRRFWESEKFMCEKNF